MYLSALSFYLHIHTYIYIRTFTSIYIHESFCLTYLSTCVYIYINVSICIIFLSTYTRTSHLLFYVNKGLFVSG